MRHSTTPLATTRGFTLLEVLFAIALLAAALVPLANVLASSAVRNQGARDVTYSALLAASKMEELRARAFGDSALAPPGLDSLQTDLDGYWDQPSPGYRRRWSIVAMPGHAADAVVLHVVVLAGRTSADAHLISAKTRRAWSPS
ncbi:MAG TPA: prepilin-type N-terminal cleavage/methylation domain-containing protein [Vicinamibacterales bacterium]|jgi:prepilin-type N-terminal cleavage/methylation domain-containing protein